MVRPYELFVRFLITRGKNLQALNEELTAQRLPPIRQPDYDRHHELVHRTVPNPVSDQIVDQRLEGDFLKCMKMLEVDALWAWEPRYRRSDTLSLKLMYDINQDPQLRTVVWCLLLKGVIATDICQAVNAKFSCMLKPEHVAIYGRFFCDPQRMTRTDWRGYLPLAEPPEREHLFRALTMPLDTVRTFLELPSKTDIGHTLQNLLTNSYTKARHWLGLNTPESNKEARAWIHTTLSLVDKYEKHRTGDMDDFAKTLQMEFDFIDSSFPTPDELTRSEVMNRRVGEEKDKK